MRQKGGLDELYKELDFKLAVLTRQYNVSIYFFDVLEVVK